MERTYKGIGVWLTDLELWACWQAGEMRTKNHGGKNRRRQDGSTFNFEEDYCGVKAEYAFSKVFKDAKQPEQDESMPFVLSSGNDPGYDFMFLSGHTIDVKYQYPSLIFNSMAKFRSDIAVVVHPYLESTAWRTYTKDPNLKKMKHKSRDVVLAGWITRDEFSQRHQVRDFGFGDHLYVSADDLTDIYELFDLTG